jgi:choline-sulfatase
MAMRRTMPGNFFAALRFKGAPPAEGTPEARYLKFLKAAYASEVRRADESIRNVDALLSFGYKDLVIVISDHGEELMEHGQIGHRFLGGSLSQELIRIPMLVKYPENRGAGAVVETPVSLVDIVPTIRGVLGQKPIDGLPGVDLSARPAKNGEPERTVFCELSEAGAEVQCAVEHPWKLVKNETLGRARLFDLSRDPEEKKDISAESPAILQRLEGALDAWRKIDVPAWPLGRAARLSDEELQRLRAMGYIQ